MLAQDEREVEGREERRRRYAGPATSAAVNGIGMGVGMGTGMEGYKGGEGMKYAPPPR